MKLFGIAAFLAATVKILYKILEIIVLTVFSLLVYFGLWIPVLYLCITGIFIIMGSIDLTTINTNSILFFIGLSLTLLGSLIITVRHLIINPISDIIKTRKSKQEFKKIQQTERERMMYEKDPAKYFAKYEGGPPHHSHPVYRQDREQRHDNPPPLVYHSNVDPSLIIHEYSHHFEIFREDNNGRMHRIDIREKPRDMLAENTDDNKKKKKKKSKRNKRNYGD